MNSISSDVYGCMSLHKHCIWPYRSTVPMYRSVGISPYSSAITLHGQKIHYKELCIGKQKLIHCVRRLILIAISCRLRLYSTLQFTNKTKLLEKHRWYSSIYCPYSQFHPLTANRGLVRWIYTMHQKETDCWQKLSVIFLWLGWIYGPPTVIGMLHRMSPGMGHWCRQKQLL